MSGPFATATEFCEWSGMAIPSDLARLQSLLDSASSLIRGYAGQTLSSVLNDTVTLYPRVGEFALFLPEHPVVAIDSVTVDGTLLASSKYVFEDMGEVVRIDGLAWIDDWTESVVIQYDHGYAETSDEFKQIKTVCMQVVKRAYTQDETGQAISQGGIPIDTAGFPMALFLTSAEEYMLPATVAAVG